MVGSGWFGRSVIMWVKVGIGSFMLEDICNKHSHAVLTFELRPLNALEALSVRLLAKDLLLVRHHASSFDQMENRMALTILFHKVNEHSTIVKDGREGFFFEAGAINFYLIRLLLIDHLKLCITIPSSQ